MTDLTLPIIRFRSADDCRQGREILADQQFEVRLESETEISCTPWDDLDDALELMRAEGIDCMRAEKPVTRLGPQRPRPLPGL